MKRIEWTWYWVWVEYAPARGARRDVVVDVIGRGEVDFHSKVAGIFYCPVRIKKVIPVGTKTEYEAFRNAYPELLSGEKRAKFMRSQSETVGECNIEALCAWLGV